jgi:lysophospholipase L1-like esterase
VKLLLSTAMLATTLIATANASHASTELTYYVSLGDSAAAGEQPTGVFDHGYADQLHARLQATMPELRLVKLGCSGESAESLISGGVCDYPSGSQLNAATNFLQAHPGQIEFITINIGVNDILDACMRGPGLIDPVCERQRMPALQANLASILEALKDAAPDVPIAGMTYWDPFLGFWTFDPLGKVLAVLDYPGMRALNNGLVATYRDEGALVANVAGPAYFDIGGFTPLVQTRWGRVPANVATTCRWTWFCTGPFAGDPHPNTRGYGVVADAFQAVLPV